METLLRSGVTICQNVSTNNELYHNLSVNKPVRDPAHLV